MAIIDDPDDARRGVVIVGSGFSRVSVAERRGENEEEDVIVRQRGSCVGGECRYNSPRGVACDVASHLYSLCFAPNPEWVRSLSPGAQIGHYLEQEVRDNGLWPWISLEEEILDAARDEQASLWSITTTRRNLTANILIYCTGPRSEPIYPRVVGLERLRGKTPRSNRRDHDVSAANLTANGADRTREQHLQSHTNNL